MPARTALFVFLLASQVGCFAGILPPSRTEVGTQSLIGGSASDSGVRFTTGAHLASGQTRRDGRLDVGAGFVYERLASPPPAASEDRALGAAPMEGEVPPAINDARGGYIEVSGAVQRGRAHRTWVGARSEVLRQAGPDGNRALGTTVARLAWEVYAPVKAVGAGSDSSGAFGAGLAHGAAGLGLFVESGVRYGEGEEPAFIAIGGVSLRLPWLAGFVIDPTPKW
jgi:hypothetical protein